MKKIIMLFLLSGAASMQALTIKNNSDLTVKVSMDGSATKQQNYVLRAGETTPNIALAPWGHVYHVKVDNFYESGKGPSCGEFVHVDVLDDDGIYRMQKVKIECIGDRRGAVIKPGQLAIVRRNDSFFGIQAKDNFIFSGSKKTGYTFRR